MHAMSKFCKGQEGAFIAIHRTNKAKTSCQSNATTKEKKSLTQLETDKLWQGPDHLLIYKLCSQPARGPRPKHNMQ